MRGLQSTVALWYLGLDSELLFVGDAGTTEAGRQAVASASSGPTTRASVLADARRRPRVDACTVHGRRSGGPSHSRRPRSRHFCGTDRRAEAADLRQHPRASLRSAGPDRRRERVLEEHDALEWRSRLSAVEQARLVLEVFNLFDADASDIDYFYTSRLTGRTRRGGRRHPHASGASALRVVRRAGFVLS